MSYTVNPGHPPALRNNLSFRSTGCTGIDYQQVSDLLTYNANSSSKVYHPAWTCPTGTDSVVVVDPRLKLKGVPAICTVETPVQPTLVSANPNTATDAGQKSRATPTAPITGPTLPEMLP